MTETTILLFLFLKKTEGAVPFCFFHLNDKAKLQSMGFFLISLFEFYEHRLRTSDRGATSAMCSQGDDACSIRGKAAVFLISVYMACPIENGCSFGKVLVNFSIASA